MVCMYLIEDPSIPGRSNFKNNSKLLCSDKLLKICSMFENRTFILRTFDAVSQRIFHVKYSGSKKLSF